MVGIVSYAGNILLVRKRNDSSGYLAGMWHIPGETLEDGEDDEAVLKRGIREEAGIEIKVFAHIGNMRTPHKNTLVNWYFCDAVTFTLQSGSDVNDARWVAREEVAALCSEKGKALWPREAKLYFSF